jgi:hypothetical protein
MAAPHPSRIGHLETGVPSDPPKPRQLHADGASFRLETVPPVHARAGRIPPVESAATGRARLPDSQLRFSTSVGETSWGIQFTRDIAREGERSHWIAVNPNTPAMASRFGVLSKFARPG